MQKTIERPLPEAGQRATAQQRPWNRKWASIAVVAVLGAAAGLGLSALSGGGLTPQEIAEIRAEQVVEYHAGQWARQNAPTPQEIAALRYAQYPDAHRGIWESQQP